MTSALVMALGMALVSAGPLNLTDVPEPLLAETRPFAGALASVTVVGAEPERARAGIEDAFLALARDEEVMSEWRPESPLSALNAAAGSGRWTELPADLCMVLWRALDGARRSGGLFDPSWAALRNLWRFEGSGAVPDRARVRRRCKLVGWARVEVEGVEACRARLPRTGMALGLGGVAKGWAVDRAAEALRARGLADFLVEVGGDVYAAGRRGGKPWTVAIRDPRGEPGAAIATLHVSDEAVSTSGDYEHFFVAHGRRYHHLIDPRTCEPAQASRAATVVAARAIDSDILAKAVFVAGGRKGLSLAAQEGARALVVTARGELLSSPGLVVSRPARRR